MATFEEEYKRIEKFVDFVTKLFLLPKKIDLRGAENFAREGPEIIVGNHIGSYKDVSIMVRIRPRLNYFTANKEIFTREGASALVLRHLHRHMGKVRRVRPRHPQSLLRLHGHVRVLEYRQDRYDPRRPPGQRRDSVLRCQDYLRRGRAVIALQGRGRVQPKDPNPYVAGFRRGVSVMAYNLYKKGGISVPVTPLSIFGRTSCGRAGDDQGQRWRPLFVKDYWTGEEVSTVEAFRAALQQTVTGLFRESLSW